MRSPSMSDIGRDRSAALGTAMLLICCHAVQPTVGTAVEEAAQEESPPGEASIRMVGVRETVPLLNVTSAGFAKVPAPMCPDGKTLARDVLMWNVMYEPNKDGTNRGNDLSKMASTSTGVLLCVYPTYWKNWTTDLGGRGWPTSVSAIWPSLAGPWCDKKANPNCKPEYIMNNGGCPQAVDMELHKAALRAGLDAQVPIDFEGYVSYDMEGWMGNEGNKSGYAEACGGADAFHAAAKTYFTVTMQTVKAYRPKAKFGFYGRPVKDFGGRSYDCECGSTCERTCAKPDTRYADSLRAGNDELMWFFDLVDFIQPSLYLSGYTFNGTEANWGARNDFVRVTMRECERISNLTGGKPIVPQSDYQYFGSKGWPMMNNTRDIVNSLLAPFEFPHTAGVGVWSDDDAQDQPANRTLQNQNMIDEVLAPIINDYATKSCACSAQKCSSHGRCHLPLAPYPFTPPLAPPPPSTRPDVHPQPLVYDGPMFGDDSVCFCDTGYSGTDCSKHDAGQEAEVADIDSQQATEAETDGVSTDITCPDGRSTCPAGSTCASLSTGAWGCCATPNAVMCDCAYCCPQGYKCALDPANNGKGSATHCEKA